MQALVDESGPLTNGAVSMKTSTHMKYGRLFWQFVGLVGLCLCLVIRMQCTFTQLRPNRARLDRSQLIFVAQQHQTRMQGHTLHQPGHEFQVNHGGLIDHHQICGQDGRRSGCCVWVVLQELMQRDGLRWNSLSPCLGQTAQGRLNGQTQATCSLAGRCGKMNAQGLL